MKPYDEITDRGLTDRAVFPPLPKPPNVVPKTPQRVPRLIRAGTPMIVTDYETNAITSVRLVLKDFYDFETSGKSIEQAERLGLLGPDIPWEEW